MALPFVVLRSPGYRDASHTARSLLIDICAQFNGTNNGKLVACASYLKPLGWTSNDTITRGLRELIECGLLVETRKGMRPNRAAWFAFSWNRLDVTDGLDIDPKCYPIAPYLFHKNAALIPPHGVRNGLIAPPHGVRNAPTIPSNGAIR